MVSPPLSPGLPHTRSRPGSNLEYLVSHLTETLSRDIRSLATTVAKGNRSVLDSVDNLGGLVVQYADEHSARPAPLPDFKPLSAEVAPPSPMEATVVTSSQSTYRPVRFHPPPALEARVTLGEFRVWRDKWNNYFRASRLNLQPLLDQRIQLISDITVPMCQLMESSVVLSVDATISVEDTLDSIQAFLRSSRSLVLDRKKLFQLVKRPGEPVEEFIVALKSLALDADARAIDFDGLMLTLLVANLGDQRLLERFLATRITSFEEASTFLISQDQAFRDSVNLSVSLPMGYPRPGPVAAVAAEARPFRPSGGQRRFQSRSGPGRSGHPPRHSAPPKSAASSRSTSGPCPHCGFQWHNGPKCPAASSQCHRCGQWGHFSHRCPSPVHPIASVDSSDGWDGQGLANPDCIQSVFIGGVTESILFSGPVANDYSVRLGVKGGFPNSPLHMIQAYPDSGAARSVAGPDFLAQCPPGIPVQPPDCQLTAAGGHPLTMLGSVSLDLSLAGRTLFSAMTSVQPFLTYPHDTHGAIWIRFHGENHFWLLRKLDTTYDRGTKPLSVLADGSPVRLQDPRTMKWSSMATILHHDGRRYLVQASDGNIFWRNRRLLHPGCISSWLGGEGRFLFGHDLRSTLPNLPSRYTRSDLDNVSRRKSFLASQKARYYDCGTKPLSVLADGSPVRLQDPRTLKWSSTATILHHDGRRYLVQASDGNIFWRNRRLLHPG
eukprot:maker-scaffold411_size179879-snap-gene-0.29 protein:Tk06326 transcript:maker-scaffold411_size179879-snap-gene-0.29-mRNA-1 annotation:"hypothetical protein DAPPUDRAFT_257720"